MLILASESVVYSMSPHHTPAGTVKSGNTAVFETQDCFGGQIGEESRHMGSIDWNNINPATGPLYVEDAAPGDVLKVEVRKIELTGHATVCDAPNEGIIGLRLSDESTKIIPIRDGMAVFNDRLSFPIAPMIGVIGTAPADDEIPTGTPGLHGGNMDCNRIGEGTTLYLPVNVPGALLAMGDLHAVMGDGEVVVCGAEISGAVTVRVTVLKGCDYPTPFLVTPEDFMTIYSDDTLDAAAVGATLRMRDFLIRDVGMESHEAGMALSLAGNVRICQAVDPQKTCRMEVPRCFADRYRYAFA